jgi:hypothetical protein
MKTIWLFVCLSVCRFAAAQTPTREQLVGTWIGVHTELDLDTYCPSPAYIKLDADGGYTLGIVDGTAAPIRSSWGIEKDTIRLDTIHYAPQLVQLTNDLLRIGVYYPMVFRRLQDVAIDSASTYRRLAGHVWLSDKLAVHLYADGRAALENPRTKQRTAHFWQLAKLGSSVFLIISGNQHNRDGGYKPLWQLVSANANQFQAIGWNGQAIATETFRFVRELAPGDSCKSSGFQTCSNCFTHMWYNNQLGQSVRRYDLKRLINQHFHPVNSVGQSGLVKIEFAINCMGERGLFSVEGFDDDYCPKTFDSRLTGQLLQICREHVKTDLSLFTTDQPDADQLDSAISLTFRLTNGRLTDVLP